MKKANQLLLTVTLGVLGIPFFLLTGCSRHVHCQKWDITCDVNATVLFYDVCRVPYYRMMDPIHRGAMMIEYGAQAAKGRSASPQMFSYGVVGGANTYYGSGGVLALNGKIYAPPNDQNAVNNQVLVIDPTTPSFSTITGLGGAGLQWSSGALAPDGKIYALPFLGTTSILKIDPNTNTLSFVATVPQAGYLGAALAANGKIYGIPFTAGRPAISFDPVTLAVATLPGPTTGGWVASISGLNGKIYALPQGNTPSVHFLEIDPDTNTATTFGSAPGSLGWFGAGLAPDGRYYALPVGNHQSIFLDTSNRTVTYFGPTYGANSFEGNVSGPDGIIYGTSRGSATADEIDYRGPSISTGTAVLGTQQTSGILIPNGNIYMIPRTNISNYTYMQTNARGTLCANILQSPFFNKF